MSNTTRSAQFNGFDFEPSRKGTKFISFYSKADDAPEAGYLTVEHRSETAAAKGSWQSASMRNVWLYRGYAAVTEK